MIGGLLYLTVSRPNIMQAIYFFARFQTNSKQTHDQAVKKIFRYLKGTLDFGLWYKKNGDFMLKEEINVDWVECVDDRKSTSGLMHFSWEINWSLG